MPWWPGGRTSRRRAGSRALSRPEDRRHALPATIEHLHLAAGASNDAGVTPGAAAARRRGRASRRVPRDARSSRSDQGRTRDPHERSLVAIASERRSRRRHLDLPAISVTQRQGSRDPRPHFSPTAHLVRVQFAASACRTPARSDQVTGGVLILLELMPPRAESRRHLPDQSRPRRSSPRWPA